MTDLGLPSLVAFGLEKRVSPAIFTSLLKQVNHKQEITVEDVRTLLKSSPKLDPLAVMFIASASLSDQTLSLNFSTVIGHLRDASDINQQLLLTALVSQLRECTTLPFNATETAEINTQLIEYLRYLLEQKQGNTQLIEAAGRLMAALGAHHPNQANAVPLAQEQADIAAAVASKISESSPALATELHEILERAQKRNTRSLSTRQSVSSASLGHAQQTSFFKSNKLPKLVWLNSAVESWSTHKSGFLAAFEQFVRVKNSQNILSELIATSFEGYIISQQTKDQQPQLARSWELFITKRLPLLIRELKLKNVESALMNALSLDPKIQQAIKVNTGGGPDTNDDMFNSFPSTATDIRHDFLRSCIALQLLPTSAFEAILKQDAAADSRRLETTDNIYDDMGQLIDLQESLNRTLVDINTEFIPLEESGLLEFLQSVEKMEGTKQMELSKLILTCIDTFIANDDTSHLYRLCLTLALVPSSLHAIIFHVSPAVLLKPIMNFLDTWQTNSDDDMNFQDTYSAFGCVFLLFLRTVKEFNIPLAQLIALKTNIDQSSFCISFLTNMGRSSGKTPEDDLNQHSSEVLSGWMSALFDSGGISDDLMRLSTVQECFELFPIIFQQAFVACKQGLTDVETVRGGLEYFLQPFLLSTIVGLLSWCEEYLWKGQDVELLVNLMKTLVTPLELSGESVHIHRVIMSIYAPSLLKRLTDMDSSSHNNIKVDSTVLSGLRQSVRVGKTLGFFELDTSSTIVNFFNPSSGTGDISITSAFQMEFQALLSWGQSSTVSRFDHLFIPNMERLLGVHGLIDCFVEQMFLAQQMNKNPQATVELAAFLLLIDAIGYSSDARNTFLNSLKNETVSEKPLDTLLPGFKTVKALVEKRLNIGETPKNEYESTYLTFYDKLIDTAQHLISLD